LEIYRGEVLLEGSLTGLLKGWSDNYREAQKNTLKCIWRIGAWEVLGGQDSTTTKCSREKRRDREDKAQGDCGKSRPKSGKSEKSVFRRGGKQRESSKKTITPSGKNARIQKLLKKKQVSKQRAHFGGGKSTNHLCRESKKRGGTIEPPL